MNIRTQLGYGAHGEIGRAGMNPAGYDWGAAKIRLLEVGIVSWNLLDAKGQEVEVGPDAIALLDKASAEQIATELDASLKSSRLPNGSGARSRNGSSANGSPSPISTIRPRRSSTRR